MIFVLQNGWSPLNAASWKGHLDVVKTLLEAGANINQATKDGKTSLDLAVERGHNETIQLLKTYQNKLLLTHQAQLANERARIAEERATRVEQELSETKLHYEALLQQADEKAKRADKRAKQELLETKQHYDALQQQIRLQVQLSEERVTRAEQELLEIKRQRDAMQQQTRLQVQNADERARRAEERATTAEKEHLGTKQQRDAMQQQMRLQVQRAGVRARRAEERATTAEKEHLETKQQRDAMQQQMRLQVQRADERAKRAEERASTTEKEHLETKQQRDAMQQQMRLQVQRADERARWAEERASTAEKEHLETKQQRDAMQQQMRLQVQRADERARRAEERASTTEKEHLETKQQRDAMQQQMRLQVQRADERARRAEERASTAEKEHLETKQQRDAMQQQIRLQVQRADERARRAEERASTAEREHLETKQQRDAMQQQIRLQVQQADERAARADQQIPDYMKSSWRVGRDEIEETGEVPLGVGGWGEVRVATFRGARVAAKFIHNTIISPHNVNLFLREMHMAASVRHPNLLLFIGASLDDNKPVILTELMPTNLRSIIVSIPHDHVITIGIDVARGLNYLHLMRPDPIIHRDVSSANVLLEPIRPGNWKAKVSDYGSANFLSKVITMGPGNPSYAAPESFNPKLQSPKMDVYSYGILLLEMATGQFPDHKLQAMQLDTLPWQEMAKMIRSSPEDLTPASSKCTQLWIPHPPLRHCPTLVSVSRQLTSSNQMGSLELPAPNHGQEGAKQELYLHVSQAKFTTAPDGVHHHYTQTSSDIIHLLLWWTGSGTKTKAEYPLDLCLREA
eukprot:Em0007g915a